MTNKPTSGIFSGLAKQFRKLAGLLVEKPTTKADEYVLEHILLYHGLVGSSEENQRQFRDVRVDIIDAVNDQNSLNLCIAFKLPPLWWDSKLATIFAEIAEDKKAQALATLLPEDKNGDLSLNAQPLKHEDWRVRANAASVLAFLQDKEAIPHLVAALNDTADSVKPAFCHITYALGQLKGSIARTAIADHLYDEEPWSRVDAARALALFDRQEVAKNLAEAMLCHHKLSDYMAVTIARAIEPSYFLNHEDSLLRQAGLEMAISIIEASRQTYTAEIVIETMVPQCWPFIFKRLSNNATAQELRAAYCLSKWLADNMDQLSDQSNIQAEAGADSHGEQSSLSSQIDNCKKSFTKENYGSLLVAKLKEHKNDKEQSQLRHILALISDLHINEALPEVAGLLDAHSEIVDCVIDTLGTIGDDKTAGALVALANQVMPVNERVQLSKQAQPAEEENRQQAEIYWRVLKALAGLPSPDSVQFLLLAVDDFAPDKRAQALASLLAVYDQLPNKSTSLPELKGKVIESLDDPSTQVKTVALSGVADMNMIEALPRITKFTDVSEVSLRRQSFAVLTQLSNNGHKDAVVSAIKAKQNAEIDKYKRQRLADFLQSL